MGEKNRSYDSIYTTCRNNLLRHFFFLCITFNIVTNIDQQIMSLFPFLHVSEYIPLQKVISENNLMIYAAKAALTDPEYYVQCTGLKCLAAATKIDCIWKEVLIDNPHIYVSILFL